MLAKKDFLKFCDKLMAIEVEMEHDAEGLQKYIKNKKAIAMLKQIAEDEIRHEGIVRQIRKIVEEGYGKK